MTRVRVNRDGSTAKRYTSYVGKARVKDDELLVALEGLFALTDAPSTSELRSGLHREWSGFVKEAELALATGDVAQVERLLEDYQAARDLLETLSQADLIELSGEVSEAAAALEGQALRYGQAALPLQV